MTEQQVAKGLMRAGRLTAQQIEAAVKSRKPGVAFAQTVVELGYLTMDEIVAVHPNAFEVPIFESASQNSVPASASQSHTHPPNQSNSSSYGFAFRPEDAAEIDAMKGDAASKTSVTREATLERGRGERVSAGSRLADNAPVASTTVVNTPVANTPVANTPVANTPVGSKPSNGMHRSRTASPSASRAPAQRATVHAVQGTATQGSAAQSKPIIQSQSGVHSRPVDQSQSVEQLHPVTQLQHVILPVPKDIGLGHDDVGLLDNSEVVYDGDDGLVDDSRGPTVRWCNELLKIAVQTRSSDMHLEPRPDGLLPRYRIDGHLRPGNLLPREFMAAVISRFKVLANLDIAENRMPQDGRFRATVGGRLFDFRVSTLPGMHGEKVVLRLLDRSSLVTDLTRLGFTPGDADRFQKMLERSHGMILVTGPTGSGKTTTLYAALAAANDETKNVITVEDPIEYELEGVTQTRVQHNIGLTFAMQLRAILRQDPDVILVGEIRDGETADVSIRAALTGHLVLSTLHTNSAVGAVTRLQDMGIAPYLIASSLSGVIAQRLVRMICRHCKAEMPADHPQRQEAIERLRLSPDMPLYYGEGCENCTGTGMRGRLALVELLEVDSSIRKAVMARQDAGDLRSIAIHNGMKTLWQDGMEKLAMGLTTGNELIRVLMGHDEEE